MLCWALVEQAGHEHTSDEYKRLMVYYYSTLVFPILGTKYTRDRHSGSQRTDEGCASQADKHWSPKHVS